MQKAEHSSIRLTAAPPRVPGEGFYAALSEIGQLLVRSLDPPLLYEAIIKVLEHRIGARLAMVGEVDHQTGWFQRVAPIQPPSDLADVYPERLPFGVAEPSFWKGIPQVVRDIRQVPHLESFRDAYARHGVTSVAAVPILSFGEVRAALVIRASDAAFFSPDMIALLQQAATSIGLGLEAHQQRGLLLKAVHDEGRQRRALRLLSEMVKVISRSKGERDLLVDACRVARRPGGYAVAWIGLLDDQQAKGLCVRAHDGFAETDMAGLAHSPLMIGSHDDVAMMAARTGQPQLKHALSTSCLDWPVHAEAPDMRALLALPLSVDASVIGAFVIGANAEDAFTPVEIQIFSEMVIELGLGIQMQRARAARHVAEHDLRFNLHYFQAVLAHQYAGILLISEEGRVKFANAAFCSLFDLTQDPAELENMPAEALYEQMNAHCEEPSREWVRMREILTRGEVVSGDEISIRDGRVLVRDYTPIDIDGVAQGFIWHYRDITEQKLHEGRVERLAFYDVVTGLPNRRLLFRMLEEARSQVVTQGSLLAVGVLDLDRFKSVNDTVGHGGGDQVLVEASARIRGILREADVLARYGGDEFALLISGLDSTEQLDAISRCILQALRVPFNLHGEQVFLSASIGWTMFPIDDADADGLIRHADLAMYAAKDEGKDRGLLYQPEMELRQQRLQMMRDRVATALSQSQLRLLYQPIVYIDGLPGLHGVAGMEALLRLQDDEKELIEPIDFMHVLDDPQLARPIGRFVLGEALRQCATWMNVGISIPVSVNISTRHLLHPAFFSDIDTALEAYPGVMDVGFGIEVTETGPSLDHGRAKVVIEECRRRGIRVGLDDFGTGSASLSHIQQLDIEHIKLDQSFVRDILDDDRNMAIAAGVITTARMLAKAVIAEGVETSAQGDVLASLGCHQLQGFWISRPMPGDAVVDWVRSWVPPVSWEDLVNERQSLLEGQRQSGSS